MIHRTFFLGVALPSILIMTPLARRPKTMPDNRKNLQEAHARALEFESKLDPDRLREADRALENVDLAREADPKVRAKLRSDCLVQWLELVALLDRHLDPDFDPDDVPEELVQPPPVPGGAVLRAGADPALVPDSRAREQYEKAIAANRAKAERYRVQTQLRRIGERIAPQAENFVRRYYTSAPADQRELKGAIERIIKDSARKARLSGFLAP
jgi:hypothetical protein